MASIKPYKAATGRRWRVQYRSPDGKSRTKQGFRTKTEAELWAAEQTTQIGSGTWLDPAAGKITIRKLSEVWWEGRQQLKESTLKADKDRLENAVLPKWGDRQAVSIRPSEVQAWVGGLDLSGSTIRHLPSILAQMLDVAVQDRMIPANPAREVKLPRKVKAVKVYLAAQQLALLAECAGDNSAIVWVLGTVGLRWGELAGLQVGDIDQQRSRLKIHRSVTYVEGRPVVSLPKTHARREVSVSLPVMRMLVKRARGRDPKDWIFTSPDGQPLRPQKSDRDFFAASVRRAQKKDEDFPTLTPHGLRHVAAGLMISQGMHVKAVQRQLGHASAAMTLDTYADLFDSDLDSVGSAMGEAISGVVEMSWNQKLRAL